MIVLFFTASRKQTSYKDRNVIEENNDWIIFHSVSILCYTFPYQTEVAYSREVALPVL